MSTLLVFAIIAAIIWVVARNISSRPRGIEAPPLPATPSVAAPQGPQATVQMGFRQVMAWSIPQYITDSQGHPFSSREAWELDVMAHSLYFACGLAEFQPELAKKLKGEIGYGSSNHPYSFAYGAVTNAFVNFRQPDEIWPQVVGALSGWSFSLAVKDRVALEGDDDQIRRALAQRAEFAFDMGLVIADGNWLRLLREGAIMEKKRCEDEVLRKRIEVTIRNANAVVGGSLPLESATRLSDRILSRADRERVLMLAMKTEQRPGDPPPFALYDAAGASSDDLEISEKLRENGLMPSSPEALAQVRSMDNLARSGASEAGGAILVALQSEDPGVVSWAAAWAGHMGLLEAGPQLRRTLRIRASRWGYARKSAATAMANLRMTDAIPELETAAEAEKVEAIRDAIYEAVVHLNARA